MSFPAKILLFGEYGILLNSMGLAIPYPHFSGYFSFIIGLNDNSGTLETESNGELKKLLNYLKKDPSKFQYLNIEHFEHEIGEGIYFNSTVPQGSGLGSSGTLTAAIYDRYALNKENTEYQKIKGDLTAIETYFHGVSSGIDPFISLVKRPVVFNEQTIPVTSFDLSPFLSTYTLFLINTHSKGNTGHLVTLFMERIRQFEFKEKIINEYIPLINQTINAVLESDFIAAESCLVRYSRFQLSHFSNIIPDKMKKYFLAGLKSRDFYLKICGSGGGGYLLGIARDRLKAEAYFNLNQLDYTVV